MNTIQAISLVYFSIIRIIGIKVKLRNGNNNKLITVLKSVRSGKKLDQSRDLIGILICKTIKT